jgi:AcrR family transcriptional regulator
MRDTSARLKKTKDAIVGALFALLENNNYEEITILEIAGTCDITRRTIYRHFRTKEEMLQYSFTEYTERLSEYILLNDPKDFRELCVLYFSFWDENIDYLDKLRKAGILYKFGDSFEGLIHLMAGRIKHQNKMNEQQYKKYLEQYKFHFAYRTAGFWRVTELWSSEEKRRRPMEMADIMVEIAEGSV